MNEKGTVMLKRTGFRKAAFGLTAGLALLATACSGGSDGPSSSVPTATSTAQAQASFALPNAALSVSEIVRQLRPSVVRIDVVATIRDASGQSSRAGGVGTGVIIDDEGHIVTNNHVVTQQDGTVTAITVTLSDECTFEADIVGTDPPTDLAVLKIDGSGLIPAPLGVSSSLEVGADVIAIGHALGLAGEPTVTRGVVSAKNRAIRQQPYSISGAIQTDASINPGNSGGPLVDAFGNVVGINTAVIVDSTNIGFAISIDLAKPIVRQILASGQVQRAFLGVTVVDITPDIASSFGLPTRTGAAIMDVVPGSPAAVAGLQERDIVVLVSDRPIMNSGDFLQVLSTYEAGATFTIEFIRAGDLRETTVTLTDHGA